MEKSTMKIYYDTESDYLEIVFGKPTECDYVKIGPDTYKKVDIKTGEIKGYAIFNVKKSDSPLKSINIDLPKGIIDAS
ncbi:MAG: hypothetical protein AABX79_02145 [Nanoarchaeota archaeon]